MRRAYMLGIAVLVMAGIMNVGRPVVLSTPLEAQQRPPVDNRNTPILNVESVPDPLKLPADMNLGEVLGVAVNSKGTLIVLNHPGTAGAGGPLYGNATTQILEFDSTGKYVREIGKGVYGLGYSGVSARLAGGSTSKTARPPMAPGVRPLPASAL